MSGRACSPTQVLFLFAVPVLRCRSTKHPPANPVSNSPQLVETPASMDGGTTYQQLAYIEAYDAVLDGDYAFVAYRETDSSGEWRVRIKSLQTAGGVFEPAAMKSNARSAGAQGKPWFVWGFNMEPSPPDARHVEFRVHVADGQPSEIEMFLQLRKFDGAPDAAKSVKFPWPAA